MQFIPLESAEQLEEIKGSKGCVVIFKHNTTCPISKGAKSRFEQEADCISNVDAIYFLDLLAHRDLSDAVAEKFDVQHQSPQLLVIKNGACTYNESLSAISAEAAADAVES